MHPGSLKVLSKFHLRQLISALKAVKRALIISMIIPVDISALSGAVGMLKCTSVSLEVLLSYLGKRTGNANTCNKLRRGI